MYSTVQTSNFRLKIMSRKLKIIITIIITLVLISLVGFLFFYKNNNGETGTDIIKNALPFGGGADETSNFIPTPINTETDGSLNEGSASSLPKIFQLHKTAIAGAFPFVVKTNKGEEKTLIRYLERGVGHIFETNMDTMEETRISNVTRLKIYEAVWGNSGKNVIIRYLDDTDGETIRSFLIKLTGVTPTEKIPGEGETPVQPQNTETEGVFLPEKIKNVALSSDSMNIFYLIDTGSTAFGTKYNLETGDTSRIFNSPFTEWLPQWPNENIIAFTTKASEKFPGYLYFLNLKTGDFEKILGGIQGLTTLTNPTGDKVLYSENIENKLVLNLYTIKNKTKQEIPFVTLPEKCVWGNVKTDTIYCAVPTVIPVGSYPDGWYQGLMSFSDEIWEIDTDTLTPKLVVTPMSEAREEMDVINPILDPSGKYFFFTNKKDLSLWGVRLSK